jgi:septum formation protein
LADGQPLSFASGSRPLILASRSPQRRAILEQLGIEFSVVVSEVEERERGEPEEVALQNAHHKALAVAERHPDGMVLGVDTVVSLNGRLYGKPADVEEARATLRALSAHRHLVISGLCLVEAGETRTAVATTAVCFRLLSDELVEWYLDSEEWRERAGGYAIQGRGAALVDSIEGDYLNVVGLPVTALLDLAPGLALGPKSPG